VVRDSGEIGFIVTQTDVHLRELWQEAEMISMVSSGTQYIAPEPLQNERCQQVLSAWSGV
jgi:hypothetical protein